MSPRFVSRLAGALALAAAAGCDGSAPLAPGDAPASDRLADVAHLVDVSSARASPDAALDDAQARLVPALGARGAALRGALARLQAAPDARLRVVATREVVLALDELHRSAPAALLADVAALRLDLEATLTGREVPTP
ncbi:hypothetical protein PYV61_16835 [Roseisolibacter sp. H3M3-2]|nr:hypothetical protein [Roseisolibacter sp. H3M3-2]